ncbi:MAG: VOC family protein [Candidatus Helarchaeota archaeon]
MNEEIRQIGLVFKDIDEQIKNYKAFFGISSVDVFEGKVKKNIYNEKLEKPVKLKLGMARIGDTQLEFIQPLEGRTIYNDFLENKGGGIHHLGIYIEDFENKINDLESRGEKMLWNGNLLGIRFAYFDTIESLSFVTEFIEVKTKKI